MRIRRSATAPGPARRSTIASAASHTARRPSYPPPHRRVRTPTPAQLAGIVPGARADWSRALDIRPDVYGRDHFGCSSDAPLWFSLWYTGFGDSIILFVIDHNRAIISALSLHFYNWWFAGVRR